MDQVFMGTPHWGSSHAKLAELVANIAKVAFWQHPNRKLVKALMQDSDLLERNRKSFASVSEKLRIGSFFEEKGFGTMGLVSLRRSTSGVALTYYLDCGAVFCIFGHFQ
jgi:hypothetical protein